MYYSILSLLEETLYSDYRCDYGSVNAIQRLGWFSVNLSFKLVPFLTISLPIKGILLSTGSPHSAQGETVFLGGIFCLEYPS